jgi:hypothetical protein
MSSRINPACTRLRAISADLQVSLTVHERAEIVQAAEEIDGLTRAVNQLQRALIEIRQHVEDRYISCIGAGESSEVKAAYFETHEPPHCPTCSCGRLG